MPANLSPEYYKAEQQFRAASSDSDKLAALTAMLRAIPKHKGTAKMQADLKGRIAKLRHAKKKPGASRAAGHAIPRQGGGQIALVGPPNTGKSALLRVLTKAAPKVADYPFTTREACPGMMPFEDIALQLIDLPPVSREFTEPWVFDLIRRADLVWIVAELNNSFDELSQTLDVLAEKKILLYPSGQSGKGDRSSVVFPCPALLVLTGADHPDAAEYLEILAALMTRPWPVFPVSCVRRQGLAALTRKTFDALRIIRVYTKQPGKPADRAQPFTLPEGATVAELAELIHKDVASKFKYARIWGPSAFDGQSVQREHVLQEGDVVEVHL